MHKVEAVKNQYVGINAHLHSYWQADGEWHEFHTAYIVYLIAELKRQLRPLGYTAGIESSLQIRRMDEFDSRPESDIGIYDLDPTRVARPPQSMSGGAANAYDMVLDLPSLIDHEAEPAEYRAIAIYEARETRGRGDPVAWIKRLPNRMPVVHLKDMVVAYPPHERLGIQWMAEVGEGNMNWDGILAACKEIGVEWYAVEQDICRRDPFESLAISYRNLVRMGLS